MLRLLVLAALATATAACLEAPSVGRAADPSKAPGPAPWGSATTNAELEIKIKLLDDILDGKLTPAQLAARVEKDYPELSPEERQQQIQTVTQLMEEMKASGKEGQKITGLDREVAKAQLYFTERRFIEAATILSKVLDQDPIYPSARNLLARCFFFLQNRDRTIQELEFVLKHPEQGKDRDEVLDALFLLGAAVAESPGMSRENLQKGKDAWELYLKMAPDSTQRSHVEKGLEEINAGLRGEGRLAQALTPIRSEAGSQATPDPRGGRVGQGPAPMGPGSTGGPPAEKRADKLPADASPFDRALAEGLDALEARDLAGAETRLKAALALDARSPDALVGMGRVYVQSGRINDALKSFGEALKVNPDFMPAWHYNGMAHMMSNSPGEAVKSWEKILEKDPEYAKRYQLDRRIEVARRMAQ